LVSNLQVSQRLLGHLQDQASTGQRFFTLSEDPGSAIRTVVLQKTIELKEQMKTNVNTDQSFLSATESALASVTDTLITARSFTIAGAGQTASPSEKVAMANETQSLTQNLINTGNSKFRDRYLFGGSESDSLPFENAGSGFVKYNGDRHQIESFLDFNLLSQNNEDGVTAFNPLTTPISSDVNSTVTLDTKLANLNDGLGVLLNSIIVTVNNGGAVTQTVDLTNAETVRDVKTRIENAFAPGAITVDIVPAPNSSGIRITPAAGTVAVAEVSGSNTARDLGILSSAVASISGQDVDPKLTLLTPLSAFNNGTGATTANGLTITNGAQSKTVDISAATNVEELFNILEAQNLNLDLRINDAGDGLAITSRLSGANLSIGENGGADAASLGIRTFTGKTLLGDLNYGMGVPVKNLDVNGNLLPAVIEIDRRDGTTLSTVDLKGLNTVQDVLDAITAVDANLTATLSATGNGISIVDLSGTNPLTVRSGQVADALGIAGTDTGAVNTVPVIGSDVNLQRSEGMTSLLLQLETALRNGDDNALAKLDDQIDLEIERVNLVRGEIGSRLQLFDRVENSLLDENIVLQQSLSKEFDADLTEVVAQIAAVSSTLQSSLQIASSTSQLTLLNFL